MRPQTSSDWEEPPSDDVRALPLPDTVRDVLRSLTWPSEPGPAERGFNPRSRFDWEETSSRDEAVARVGFRLPGLGPAHELTADGKPLQQFWVCSEFASGRVDLALLPPGAGRSDSHTRITWSRWDGQPFPPPETARRPNSGDSTDLVVRGVRVHVRVRWPGVTRMLWLDASGCSVRRVELNSPEPPPAAFERLVRDPDLLPARS